VISSGISVGLQLGTQPPLSATRAFLLGARAMRLDAALIRHEWLRVGFGAASIGSYLAEECPFAEPPGAHYPLSYAHYEFGLAQPCR
jgi:hypothetical protein